MTDITPLPLVPHRDAILTVDQLATVLQLSVRSIERMDLPTVYCGKGNKLRRYIYGQVLDIMRERAA